MNIYLSYAVMAIFTIFVIVPAISHSLTGEPSYMLNLKAGMIMAVVVISLFALSGLVLWSAMTIMAN